MKLFEAIRFDGAEFVEEGNARIIKNVVLLGPTSSHGYKYRQEAMSKAVRNKLYESARIFINHASGQRDLMHLAGVFKETRHEGGKVRGNAHLLDDEFGLKFWNIARTMPEAASCSHVADGKLETAPDGQKYVEEITRVYSVDLVVQGATTSNVFEGVSEGDIPRPFGGDNGQPREKQFEFIGRCITEVKGRNSTITDEEASAMCFASWQARYESGGMDTYTPPPEPEPTASKTTNENSTQGGTLPPERNHSMEDVCTRISRRIANAKRTVEEAAEIMDPVARDIVSEEMAAENLREREEWRAEQRENGRLLAEIKKDLPGIGYRESDDDFWARLNEKKRVREATERQAAEITESLAVGEPGNLHG